MLRLRLQAVTQNAPMDPGHDIVLLLPRNAAQRVALSPGQTVAAVHRPYGVAFTTVHATGAEDSTPFFLVLDDAWFLELESRPVGA